MHRRNRRPEGFTPWEIASWIWMTGAAGIFGYVIMGHLAAWRLYRTTQRIQKPWIEEAEQLARELGINRGLCPTGVSARPRRLHGSRTPRT